MKSSGLSYKIIYAKHDNCKFRPAGRGEENCSTDTGEEDTTYADSKDGSGYDLYLPKTNNHMNPSPGVLSTYTPSFLAFELSCP